MAHDIIGKLSTEVRGARLGISAFSPHREKHGLPTTGNYTVRHFVLALCDTFCYKSILCHPQMAIRLMCFSGEHHHRCLTVKRLHYTWSDTRPSTRDAEEHRVLIQHATSLFLFPAPLRTGGLTWLMRDITQGTWLRYPTISQSWAEL